jgi:3'-5' exonuclease
MFLDTHFLKRCLFVDIETVSEVRRFEDLSDEKKELWRLKAQQINRQVSELTDQNIDDLYTQKAGIFSEFSKIVCISMGFLGFDGDDPIKIRIKSIAGDSEREILEDFVKLLTNHYNDPENSKICGHNIKEFDIPFICRRLVIHQIKFPHILDLSGKKPWQTAYILDTMDMWRFGDYKNYTSLRLLAGTLGIPSPKDDIDGSLVGKTYWIDEDIDAIVTYCQKDVITVIQVMMRYCGVDLFDDDNIEYINQKQIGD